MEDSVISNIKLIKRKLKLTIMANDHYIEKINMQKRTLLDKNLDNKSHGLVKHINNCQIELKMLTLHFFSQIL